MSKKKFLSTSAALDMLFSFPSDPDDSEVEADDDAFSELRSLENLDKPSTSSGSNCVTTEGLSSADGVLLIEPDVNNSSESDDEMNEEWSNEVDFFDNIDSSFNNEPNLKISFNSTDKEKDYFGTIFTEEILQNIVDETNSYANQPKKNKRLGCNTKDIILNWKEITSEELKAWIGMHILMGIHQLPELKNYWSTDPILNVQSVARVMTAKRFKKITETLHVNDNSTNPPRGQPGHDKLHKVRPILSQLNDSICKAYEPSSTLSIDECMIAFKGRTSLKQYMPMKPIKRGYKVWCLADSKTGYIQKFEIYCGKETSDNKAKKLNLGETVVTKLTEDVKHTGRLIAHDNYFTSFRLAKKLLASGLFSVGTVKPQRKGLPQMLKTNDKLKRGESKFLTKEGVAAIKWMDNKAVTLLTTAHNPVFMTSVNRTKKDGTKAEVPCPKAVAVYNDVMGGVDRFDQRKERYQIGRRSVKWWHRIFYFLLDLGIVNSFILWQVNKRNRNLDQLTFRIALARQLIDGYSSRKRKGRPASFQAKKCAVPDDVRLASVGNHMPKMVSNYRRCRKCSTKGKEKRTRCICAECDVPLCIGTCFSSFHGK